MAGVARLCAFLLLVATLAVGVSRVLPDSDASGDRLRGSAIETQAIARVSCSDVIIARIARPAQGRIVLGRVAVPPRYLPPDALGHDAAQADPIKKRYPYFAKYPLQVLAGKSAVRLRVPQQWKGRFALEYGSGHPGVDYLIEPCARPGHWLLYTGGLLLRRPACVELRVHSGQRTSTIKIGVARRCSS